MANEGFQEIDTTVAVSRDDEAVAPTDVLITLHGIRDNGAWQEALASIYASQRKNAHHERFKYGFFDLLRFLFPLSRRRQVAIFKERLMVLLSIISERSRGPCRVHFAAHSFGTHVLAHTLLQRPFRPGQTLGNIALMGSVLPSAFNVLSLAALGLKARIVNFCSVNDAVLLLNAALPFRSGLAGRVGFKSTFDGSFLEHRFFRFGHGGYFSDNDCGDGSWLGRYCVPALSGETVPPGTHERPKYGDFLSELMTFSKFALTSAVLLAGAFGYVFLTADGVARRIERSAEQLDKISPLTIAHFPEVRGLLPGPIYRAVPGFQNVQSRISSLYQRIVDENPYVFIFPRRRNDKATMRDDDMALLVSQNNEVALFENHAPPGKAVRYKRRLLYQGPVDKLGFTSNGSAYFIRGHQLQVQSWSCDGCAANWRTFLLPPNLDLLGRPLVHELPDGTIFLYATTFSDGGLAVNFLRDAREGQSHRGVRLPERDSYQPVPHTGLDLHQNDISIAPLVDEFKDYVAVADRNSILVAGRDGTSLFVSNDANDISPEFKSEVHDTRQRRRSQIQGGRHDSEAFRNGQFCNRSECISFPIAFPATDPVEPEARVLDAYSAGGELVVEAYTIDGGIRSPSVCLRVARLVNGAITPTTSSTDQVVDCISTMKHMAYIHSRDAIAADLHDKYLVEDFEWFAVKANPVAFGGHLQETSLGIYQANLTSCAWMEGGEAVNDAIVYSDDRHLSIRCLSRLLFLNDWGLIKQIAVEGAPLFFARRGGLVASQSGATVTLYDKHSVHQAHASPLVVVQGAPPIISRWITFATSTRASLTWIDRAEIVVLTFQEEDDGSLKHAWRRAPLKGTLSDSGHYIACGKRFWYRNKKTYYRYVKEPNEVRPDKFDPAQAVTLIASDSSICKELGSPVFVYDMEEAPGTLIVGKYTVDVDLRGRGEGAMTVIRRLRQGSVEHLVEAFYSAATRYD